jgi:uncharacterized protein (TIGR03435 family)
MRRILSCLALLALLSHNAFGQSPAFDVADVHISAKTTYAGMSGGALRGGRYELRHASMVELIGTAYGIDTEKVLGGPSWLEFDRFDVIAKTPSATSADNLKLMLQAFLSERFNLVVHTDTKTVPAFVLSLGKGKPKLKEPEGAGVPGCQSPPVPAAPGATPLNFLSCHNITMEAFAQVLHDNAGAYVTTIAVDQTGLKGGWDFDFKWTSRGLLSQAGSDGISLFDAVDKQLGLKLEAGKIAVPVLVVDSVSQKPKPNPSGAATSVPAAPPAEFDVAEIKPTMPGVDGTNIGLQPNGRLDIQGASLRMLIRLAWDFNTDELVAGGPKSLDTTRWTIVAKASSVAAPGTPDQFDIDALRLMLRNLLIDRFQLKTHIEDRPITAYTLSAVKPKLQNADPLGRTGWKEGPAAGSKDPRDANTALGRLVTCTNMTMAQLAELLPSMASGYLQTPVLDMTGIEGSFDFSFAFSTAGVFRSGGQRGDGNTAGAADPSGAISLFEALSKQLGLKLEAQKRPIPVLVIDHVEEKPTEN